MAPTPDSLDNIEPVSKNKQKSNKNSLNKQNIYSNQAFVNDEIGNIQNNKASAAEDEANATNRLDFDDILPHIGEFGKYQQILFFLMIPFAFFVAFVYFTQIFITLVPERHWCRIPELDHLSVQQR